MVKGDTKGNLSVIQKRKNNKENTLPHMSEPQLNPHMDLELE